MFLTAVNPADTVLVVPGIVVIILAATVLAGIVFALLHARKLKAEAVQEPTPVKPTTPKPAAPKAAPVPPTAPGSAGKLKLYNTPPKTAAMVMAIVADKLGKPLNELRFLSIREIEA